ncbi:hypothetical protein [uncultured Aquimarina sp.]|uniref:hypothetical protein n=1 Tax=uncultured Aquimarina sp. TaxID=575652 RepID=UPI0026038942|nr:hypothetical protein [uncultured Aquimarina sp.]
MKNLILFLIPGYIFSYQIDYKSYYYNLKDFQEPKIYEYKRSNKNSLDTEYWKIISDTINKELITETFNSGFKQIEYFKEKFDESGAKMLEFLLLEDSSSTKVSKPIEQNVYLWNNPGPYKYSTKYDSRYGEVYFEKTRTYQGLEKIKILDKTYNAIKLKGEYVFKIKDQNQTFTYYQYSYYIKDIGFVKYKRVFEDHSETELYLYHIHTEEEWNNLKN